MNPLVILTAGAFLSVVITLIEPFWVLPVFILGNFVEPVQYLPQLRAYKPAVLMGGLIVISWVIHLLFKGDFTPAKSKQVTFASLFIVWVIISCLFNQDTDYLIGHARSYIPYFLFLYMIKDEKQITQILWAFIIFGVVAGIYGLYCAKMNIGFSDRGTKRIASFFSNPNMYGEINTLLIPLAIAFLFDKYPKIVKLFLLGVIALLLYGIVVSFSRKCFFALVPAIFITTTKFYTGGRKIGAVICTIFCILLAFYFFPNSAKYRYWTRISTIFTAESAVGLDAARTDTAKAGIKMMLKNPILGVGFGGFRSQYVHIAQRDADINLYTNNNTDNPFVPHNVIIEAGAYLGLIGLFLYFGLIFFSFKGASDAEKRFFKDEDRNLRVAAVYLQVFTISSMIIGQFTPFITSKFFWMVVPISARLEALSRERLTDIDEIENDTCKSDPYFNPIDA